MSQSPFPLRGSHLSRHFQLFLTEQQIVFPRFSPVQLWLFQTAVMNFAASLYIYPVWKACCDKFSVVSIKRVFTKKCTSIRVGFMPRTPDFLSSLMFNISRLLQQICHFRPLILRLTRRSTVMMLMQAQREKPPFTLKFQLSDM